MDKSWTRWLLRPIEKWRKPVQVAVQNRDVQEIVSLKKSGADFSVKTKNGQSMLHLLAKANDGLKKNDEEIFDLLMSERCIDVNEKDKDGFSALHFAAGLGNRLIALKLIEHGANVDCRNNNLSTPLHYAISMGDNEVVELLLSSGASVNAKGYNDTTSIHHVGSNTKNLDILVEYGAHVDAQDQHGQTALALSISAGYFFLVEKLCMYGADVANDLAAFFAMAKFDYKALLSIDIVTKHLAELMAADLFSYRSLKMNSSLKIRILESFRNRYQKVKPEAVWLKRIHFDERTTVYDILHMDPNERSRFICGCWEEWQNFFRPLEFDDHLSHFYRVIVACGYQARARGRLLQSAKEAWLELTDISLPDLCVDRILTHLSNSELMRMADGRES